MLQSRFLCTDPMQALSHQSFIIRLNVKGQGPERLSLNLKLHCRHKKNIITLTPAEENALGCFHGSTHELRLKSRRTISLRHMHHESSSLINHTGALSVQYAGYQCLCTGLAAWSILWGVCLPWRVGYLSFLPGVTSFYVQLRAM